MTTRSAETVTAIASASHGLWAETGGPPIHAPVLAGEIKADVAIVGAGFTGCSAALHVAKAGRRAVVLEAAETGFGAAGRNVGLVNAGMWTMPDHAPRVLGEERGERLLRQLSEAPSLVFDLVRRFRIECELETSGTLHCAVNRRGLQEVVERARQWRSRDAAVQVLGSVETAARIGSGAFQGALLDRRAGTVQPLAYARGLARAAESLGATFYFRSPVISFEDRLDAWRLSTSGGSVIAANVVVATDAYSSGPWSALRREQVLLPYFNCATDPLPEEALRSILPGREGCWDTARILSSFRRDASGRMVIGSVGALRGPGSGIHRDWASRTLHRLFPKLGKMRFAHAWSGMIGMTPDALPRLHRLERGIHSVSGFNGRGIAPGTSFGRDLAMLATGRAEDLALPVTDVREDPLRVIRAAFYDLGSRAAHLASARI